MVRKENSNGFFKGLCQPGKKTGRLSLAGVKFEQVIDGMKMYTAEQIADALKNAGFSKLKICHHNSKPWVTALARK